MQRSRSTPSHTALALLAGLPLSTSLACAEAVFPPAYGAYFAFVSATQVTGVYNPAEGPENLALVRPFVAGPALTPDFSDAAGPPFCLGFTFSSDQGPNVVSGRAGELTLSGTNSGSYNEQLPNGFLGADMSFPSNIACSRQELGDGTSPYGCTVPQIAHAAGPWVDDGSLLSVSASGGDDVGAFTVTDLSPSVPLALTSSTQLYQIDPFGPVTISWTATDAPFVMIEMIGGIVVQPRTPQATFRRGAQVLCLAPGATRSKTIPEGALALMPQPNAGEFLFLQTHAAAVNIASETEGWGTYMAAFGRGVFGVSCQTSGGGPCF